MFSNTSASLAADVYVFKHTGLFGSHPRVLGTPPSRGRPRRTGSARRRPAVDAPVSEIIAFSDGARGARERKAKRLREPPLRPERTRQERARNHTRDTSSATSPPILPAHSRAAPASARAGCSDVGLASPGHRPAAVAGISESPGCRGGQRVLSLMHLEQRGLPLFDRLGPAIMRFPSPRRADPEGYRIQVASIALTPSSDAGLPPGPLQPVTGRLPLERHIPQQRALASRLLAAGPGRELP